MLLVIGKDGNLDERVLSVVFGVGASERLEPRGATDDGARGQTVLHF